jgi:hypothetical protein
MLPGLTLDYFDLFGLHNQLVSEWGFGAVQPCKGGPPGRCSETLFFDSTHPTAQMHELIGTAIADQILANSASPDPPTISQVPEPESRILLIAGGLILVSAAISRRIRSRLPRTVR